MKSRSMGSTGFVFVAFAWLGLGACGNEDQAPLPLMPVNIAVEHRAALAARRIADDDGRLLPSAQRVFGIVLPRGLVEIHHFEHEWYFHSRATVSQLQQYFGKRLLTGKVERGGRGTVTYVEAQPADTQKKAFVTVRIGPAPGQAASAEVYIRDTPMMPVAYPSDAEARRKLAEMQRYAD